MCGGLRRQDGSPNVLLRDNVRARGAVIDALVRSRVAVAMQARPDGDGDGPLATNIELRPHPVLCTCASPPSRGARLICIAGFNQCKTRRAEQCVLVLPTSVTRHGYTATLASEL